MFGEVSVITYGNAINDDLMKFHEIHTKFLKVILSVNPIPIGSYDLVSRKLIPPISHLEPSRNKRSYDALIIQSDTSLLKLSNPLFSHPITAD